MPNDIVYCAPTYPVFFGKLEPSLTLIKFLAYLKHLGGSKSCVAIRCARLRCPTFGIHIAHIGSLVASKQVSRVNATGIITSVTDIESVRNWPKMNFVADTVRAVATSVVPKKSISIGGKHTCPNPTFILFRFFYVEPERLGECSRRSGIFVAREFSRIVSRNEPVRFTLPNAVPCIVFRGNCSFLSTSTMTVTVWDFLRRLFGGIVGVHQKLTFLGLIRGRVQARCPVLSWGATGVIVACLAQMYQWVLYIARCG